MKETDLTKAVLFALSYVNAFLLKVWAKIRVGARTSLVPPLHASALLHAAVDSGLYINQERQILSSLRSHCAARKYDFSVTDACQSLHSHDTHLQRRFEVIYSVHCQAWLRSTYGIGFIL